MKIDHKRGIRMPIRIIISAILLLVQLSALFAFFFNLSVHSTGVFTISTALGILMVIYIVNRRGNPSYKIAWIIFILLFPIFGISVFLLWGGGRVLPHNRRKMEKCEANYFPYLKTDEETKNKLCYFDISHSRQADYLTHESGFPIYDGTSSEFLSPGEKFFPRFLEELRQAEKYIFIEFFILAEGEMWDEIFEILKEKAKSGVEVKIIFDDFGSIKRQRKGFLKRVRNAGIGISVFNPIKPSFNMFMNNRNHRKIVVIDGKVALTGGINIGDEYISRIERFGHWLDCGIIIKGKAVSSFTVMFLSMWEFTTGEMLDAKSYLTDYSVDAEGFVIPYSDDPLNDRNPAEGIYMQILNSAQKYVYIATPYLIIDSSMISTLKMAAKSGVDVRIITPHIPDKKYVHPVTQYNYLELLESGIRIYEYLPGFVHSKYFVSDDKIATVGTINMDYRSFILHFECGVWINDNSTVADIKEDFEQTLSKCKEITLEEWQHRPLLSRLKEAALHIFAPFM